MKSENQEPSQKPGDEHPEYRALLTNIEQKSQEDYDKAILTLSGGALGITFAFVKNIVGNSPVQHSWLLYSAWVIWTVSLLTTLLSFYISRKALRKAIDQLDKKKIYTESPGGYYDKTTSVLNSSSGLLFIAGVILAIIFVTFNFGDSHDKSTKKSTQASTQSCYNT